ncbi:unnamed protein product [Parnassius apollo]|uniref:(apollo) hypothetical protein n=1 Tax=Parnassius apollo TaxID=110799 RepID=A0A8S3XSZ9_PARAO|nr:unnamed protein product [Parnassius apollo]
MTIAPTPSSATSTSTFDSSAKLTTTLRFSSTPSQQKIKPVNDAIHVVENFGIHEEPPQFEESKLWWMNVLSSGNPDFDTYED